MTNEVKIETIEFNQDLVQLVNRVLDQNQQLIETNNRIIETNRHLLSVLQFPEFETINNIPLSDAAKYFRK